MRKKLTSLALALAVCLGLTVPAFAAESSWKLAVPGKTDAEVFIGERTFTVRDWDLSQESHYNAEYGYEEYTYIATKTDSRQYTAKNLYTLSKGDTAVFTKGGESFNYLYITAWSDPDGDGVYDHQLPDPTGDYGYFLPADAASPQSGEYPYTASITFGLINWAKYGQSDSDKGRQDEYGVWDPYGAFPALTVTELKMRPDMLLELYGPNTLVSVTAYDESENEYDVCTILVEGNISQPTGGPQVSDWAKDRVAQAVEAGLAPEGLGTDYRVNITRAQFAAAAVKLYEAMSGETIAPASSNPFTDTDDPEVLKAAAMGFVGGVGGGRFAPDDLLTREQAAVMFAAVYTRLGGEIPAVTATAFADDASVSSWARNAVAFMNSKSIIGGTGNNNFSPKGQASIEQALLIALNMLENL